MHFEEFKKIKQQTPHNTRQTCLPYQLPRSPNTSITCPRRSAPFSQFTCRAFSTRSGSPAEMAWMISSCSAIEPQTERYGRLYDSSISYDLHRSIAEHEEIIQAISAGDPDRVEKALQVNWENGAERLGHVIDVFGERGSW